VVFSWSWGEGQKVVVYFGGGEGGGNEGWRSCGVKIRVETASCQGGRDWFGRRKGASKTVWRTKEEEFVPSCWRGGLGRGMGVCKRRFGFRGENKRGERWSVKECDVAIDGTEAFGRQRVGEWQKRSLKFGARGEQKERRKRKVVDPTRKRGFRENTFRQKKIEKGGVMEPTFQREDNPSGKGTHTKKKKKQITTSQPDSPYNLKT